VQVVLLVALATWAKRVAREKRVTARLLEQGRRPQEQGKLPPSRCLASACRDLRDLVDRLASGAGRDLRRLLDALACLAELFGDRVLRGAGRGSLASRDHDPQREVDEERDSAGDHPEGDDGDAHERRVEREPVGDAGADAAEHGVFAVAVQALRFHAPHGTRGAKEASVPGCRTREGVGAGGMGRR
jgi:hypothetical protein